MGSDSVRRTRDTDTRFFVVWLDMDVMLTQRRLIAHMSANPKLVAMALETCMDTFAIWHTMLDVAAVLRAMLASAEAGGEALVQPAQCRASDGVRCITSQAGLKKLVGSLDVVFCDQSDFHRYHLPIYHANLSRAPFATWPARAGQLSIVAPSSQQAKGVEPEHACHLRSICPTYAAGCHHTIAIAWWHSNTRRISRRRCNLKSRRPPPGCRLKF
jgi:hypothetical protein